MITCPCGHEFDDALVGRYGCPNCNGDAQSEADDQEDAMTQDTAAERAPCNMSEAELMDELDRLLDLDVLPDDPRVDAIRAELALRDLHR